MKVTADQAVTMVTSYILAKLVPMVMGSPGIGKSQLMRQIAKKYKMKLIDLRLSQCDPTDLLGFPNILGKKAGYVPMETFPIEGDAIPEGYTGWLLFLDEFNSAPPAVQAAAYKLVLDRGVGVHALHKNVAIVCAGNLETDNAIVQPMSTAMQSRLAHLELVVDSNQWVDWASNNEIDHRITDYIKFKPGNLFTFQADHTDNTYACPRTWEFANAIMSRNEMDSKDILPLLAGILSEGVAREFLTFCKIYDNLPKISQIISSPDLIKVPIEPSILFALTGAISHHATEQNFGQLMQFIERLPVEFQVVTLRDTGRRHTHIKKHPAMATWLKNTAKEIF